VELLEDRTLLSAAPTTILDLNGVSINPNQYSSTDILVRFQGVPGTPGGPTIVAGTTLGTPLPLVPGLYRVDLAPGVSVAQALAAYQAEPGVLSAEPDYRLTVSMVPNDPLLSQQWNLSNTGQTGGTPGADINAEKAWSVITGSPNVVVAVMDTGIDYDSPDLYQNIWINQAEVPNSWYTRSSPSGGYDKLVFKSQIQTATPGVITFRDLNNPVNAGLVWDNNGDGRIDAGDLLRPVSQGGWQSGSTQDGDTAHPDDLIGWNFVTNTNNPLDDLGHGTNVAGILGATGNNGTGVAGVDWNVPIMPIKFIGSDGSGAVSAFIAGLNYAVQHGAKITNNSWEGAPFNSALHDAILNAQQHGQIFVAAAGNESANNDVTPDYPASFSKDLNSVVAVAATTDTNTLASFSNYGPTTVALAAPGDKIVSTLPNGRYGVMSGTSQATPQVAAALALVWEQHPDWSYTQVINQVVSTVQKLPSLQGKVASGGILDLAAAVGATGTTGSAPPSAPGPTTYSNSTALSIAPGGQSISATFVPAGATISNLQVQLNVRFPSDGDLYAYLIAPNGKAVALSTNRGGSGADFQNTVFSSQASTPIAQGQAPFTGTYVPESALSQLNGLDAGGGWRLVIKNRGTQTGTLLDWSLLLTPAAATASPTTYSNSTALSIAPGGQSISATFVPAGATISNLQVQLNVRFPSDGDLYAYLIAPNGKAVALSTNRGGSGADFQNTVFSSQASTPIAQGQAPFTGTYVPESALSQLNGLDAGGGWRLVIKNRGTQTGTLLDWSLLLTPAAATASTVQTASVADPASTIPPSQTNPVAPSVDGRFDSPPPASSFSTDSTDPTSADQVFLSPSVLPQLWFALLAGSNRTSEVSA
jgi:subtilisin family serine protease